MTWDEYGIRYGTDKASRVEVGANFEEFGAHESHGYLALYERLMRERAAEPLRILEIGVQVGYGLKAYEDCFPNAEIVGVDIHPRCAPSDFARAKLRTLDIQDEAALTAFLAEFPDFDVIIDDAGHQSSQQIATFRRLWPRVRPRGWYVIEDIGCGYEPFFGGQADGGGPSVIAELKRLIDDIHLHRGADDVRSFTLGLSIAFVEKK